MYIVNEQIAIINIALITNVYNKTDSDTRYYTKTRIVMINYACYITNDRIVKMIAIINLH
jgi:hypothetical protein